MKVVFVVFVSLLAITVANRVTLRGSRTATNPPPRWRLGARANVSHPIKMLIGLRQRNLDKLEDLFWAVSTPGTKEYRNFRSIEEINAIIAPDPDEVKAVLDWLGGHGIASPDIQNLGDALAVRTTVAVAENLMHTTFHEWVHEDTGKKLVRVVGTWGLDSTVSPFIQLIEGLTEFPIPRYTTKARKTSASDSTLVSICPQSINTMYKVPPGTKNTGNSSICVAEWDYQYYDPADLQEFGKQFNIDIPPLAKEHIIGENDPTNAGIEATLDIQYAAGVSIGTTLWFWIESDSAWLWTYASHVYTTTPAPLIFSISYGWSEAQQCQYGVGGKECESLGANSKDYVNRVNTEFQKLGLRGISLFSASGDSGVHGRTDPGCEDKIFHPDFPGCSPYVTSVGATQVSKESGVANLPDPPPGCKGKNCASDGTEEAVSYDQAMFTSGGGFSWVSSQPKYQASAVNAYLNSGVNLPPASAFNAKGRGYPDVSAFGSEVLIVSYGIQPVGGTSASCPIVAGLMGMINGYVSAKTGKPLGFMNPLFYQMAAKQPSTFMDVIKGDNKCTEGGCYSSCHGFEASRGWDPVTGLGTPVFSEIQSYIENTIVKQQ